MIFPDFSFFLFSPFFARNKIKIQGMKISLLLLHFLRYLDLPRDWTSLSFCANANSSSLFSCSCVSLITIEISSFNPSGIRNMIDLRVSKCCGNSHNVLAQILLCFFVTTAGRSKLFLRLSTVCQRVIFGPKTTNSRGALKGSILIFVPRFKLDSLRGNVKIQFLDKYWTIDTLCSYSTARMGKNGPKRA